ncbi:sugar nucleotide-binding protein [Geobacter sp. FeAm09]|uniref:sugar nucleotide-binding protein n=1 Tax=Geobacter sp. FeAm09 TaxID=2597769 RepID=UPI0011F09448|nr:sugar nucleotide-binding protein [Geobacter sp. FeAm09]QEM69765.1 sugar nucleotide-binding protein [Geobacter sp. FeAm09]
MKQVLILGASGMLGGMITDVLSRDPDLRITATVRSDELVQACAAAIPACTWARFDAESGDIRHLLASGPFDAVINAIGIIKPYIKDDNPAQTERAVRINALFPHILARAAAERGVRVLQIATDCVYSGRDGNYGEAAPHDALDVYGKSKSLGEVAAANVAHIRCSIIGPEPKAHVSLLDWFLGQAPGATVNGFTNHLWNGVTTLHYGKACAGIIKAGLELPQKLHLVPTATITKADMLGCFAQAYGRTDITVNHVEAGTVIDRTLQTADPELNRQIWRAAGYAAPPTVPDMIAEMGRFDFRLAKLD